MLRENYVSVDVWKSSRCSSTTVIANACYIADATASTEFYEGNVHRVTDCNNEDDGLWETCGQCIRYSE